MGKIFTAIKMELKDSMCAQIPRTMFMLSLLAAGLFILSSTCDDWMVEKIEIKLNPIATWMEKLANASSEIPVMMSTDVAVGMGGIGDIIGLGDLNVMKSLNSGYSPKQQQKDSRLVDDDVRQLIKTFSEGSVLFYRLYSSTRTCTEVEFHDITTTAKWMNQLYLRFCINNVVFSDPEMYGLNAEMKTEQMIDSVKALYYGSIARLIGVILAAMGVMLLAFTTSSRKNKFHNLFIIQSMVLFALAGTIIGYGMGHIRSQFRHKEIFERRIKELSDFYESHHNSNLNKSYDIETVNDIRTVLKTTEIPKMLSNYNMTNSTTPMMIFESFGYDAEIYVPLILDVAHNHLHWEEYLGSPAILCGIGIAILFICIILGIVECYVTKIEEPIQDYNVV